MSGAFDGYEHVLPVRVYYEDTDFTGIVYHANCLRFFERGRPEFLREIGVEHAALLALPAPVAFAVTRLSIASRRAARVDDALEVTRPRSARTARIARDRVWARRARDGGRHARSRAGRAACAG